MKKFWRILKKVLLVAVSLSAACVFVIILSSAIKRQNQLVCKSIQVKIDYDSGVAFLSENEIKDKINYLNGGNIIGKRLPELDLKKLESEIRKNPFVKNAEIYMDQSQNMTVEIFQKRPILRVINNDGVSYYISENGDRIPLNDNFTSHVAIALGNVETHKDAKRDSVVQADLYRLVQFIRKDEFLNALVDQVYVRDDGGMEIVPKTGGHIIRFGTVDDNIAEKFNRLKIFYSEGMRTMGWNKYKTIDLRYKDQLVCEKRDTTKKQ